MVARQVAEVPICQIDIVGNIREEIREESLVGITQSIARQGLQQPVTVRRDGDRYPLVFGHRRFLAAQKAGLEAIPALIVEGELSESEILIAQLSENLQREDLSELDKARSIDRLMRTTGWSASQVAVELGFSPSLVSKLRSLLELPVEVQRRVAAGKISASTAVEIARVGDAETQIRLADEVVQGDLTRDEVAGRVKSARRQGGDDSAPSATKATFTIGSGQSVTIRSSALTLDSAITCLEEALSKARTGRTKGVRLTALCKILKEQGKA